MNLQNLSRKCLFLSKPRILLCLSRHCTSSSQNGTCVQSQSSFTAKGVCLQTSRDMIKTRQKCKCNLKLNHPASFQRRTFTSFQHVPIIGTSKTRTELRNISRNTSFGILQSEDVLNHLHHRLLHESPSHHISLFGSSETPSAWASAISEAEKLVGYPTSFMSLRCLLSDELANVALQARKLVGTKHPLLKTARNFVYDGKHSLQTRGLVVLLISKAAGPSSKEPMDAQGMVSGIYPSQRALAEISEMIHTAFQVHKGVVNLKELLPSDGPFKVMEFGNKMAVLSGDFLLANACTGLAQLRNTKVVELISQAIAHLTEAAFMVGFAEQNGNNQSQRRLPYGVGMSEWRKYAYLSSGSLIAQSCKGALALAGHEKEMQAMAFDFGKNMALAQQLHHEIQPFTSHGSSDFGLMSAPVLLHMEDLQAGSDERWKHSKVDIKKLHKEIYGSSALQKAQEFCSEYAQKALDALALFPSSKAKQALVNMVKAVSR